MFDSESLSLSLSEWWCVTNINDQIDVLSEENKGLFRWSLSDVLIDVNSSEDCRAATVVFEGLRRSVARSIQLT